MSSLSDKIDADFIIAYKSKEELTTSTLRLIKSALKNAEIAAKTDLSDEDVIRLLKREIKQRRDSIDQYKSGGREDLAIKEQSEIAILEKYLPAQASEQEVEKIVDEVMAELGANSKADFGRVMGASMAKLGAGADGGVVSKVVSSKLK